MDRLTDKIAALPPDATYFSLEFFPPKTQAVRGVSASSIYISNSLRVFLTFMHGFIVWRKPYAHFS